MPLSNLHVLHVCKINSDAHTCRYLSEDLLKMGEYQCLKLTGQKKHIDNAVEEYMAEDQGKPTALPLSDNCKGYPVLHHTVAGYDQKSG